MFGHYIKYAAYGIGKEIWNSQLPIIFVIVVQGFHYSL